MVLMKSYRHEVRDGLFWTSKASDEDYYDVELYMDELTARREVMNPWWEQTQMKYQMNGFRPGNTPRQLAEQKHAGSHGFYIRPFVDYANELLLSTAPDLVIFSDDYSYRQMVNGEYVISFKVWLEPTVKFNQKSGYKEHEQDETGYFMSTFINNLKIKAPLVNVVDLVDKRIDVFRKIHPYLHNKVDEQLNQLPSEQNDMVEVTINCFIDDVRFNEGCETTNLRLLPGALTPPQLYDTLLGKKENEIFSLEMDTTGEFATRGKKMKLSGVVNHVYRCTEAEVDDDLATTAGYESLAQWREALTASLKQIVETQDLEFRRRKLLTELMSIFDIGNVPQGWIEQKVIEIITRQKNRKISNQLPMQLVTTRRQFSVMNFIGKVLNIKHNEENEKKAVSQRDEVAYAEAVMQYVFSKVQWEYLSVEDFQKEMANGQSEAVPGQPAA